MKKFVSISLAAVLALSLFAGCSQKTTTLKKIVVGASPTPHAEILNAVKDDLKAQGYELVVKEFTDYVQPNLTLQSRELDANYFQHQPYLDDFNVENKTDLVSVAAIHYEPLGIYPGRTKTLDSIQEGATIAVPNDTTNEARALLLLESKGLIKVNPSVGLKATPKDIVENPKKLQFKELESAQVARALQDVDFGVINGNNALLAGLNAETNAVAKEEKDSLAATTFANILVVRKGDENREDIQALVKALKSDKVKTFINDKYKGAVVSVF